MSPDDGRTAGAVEDPGGTFDDDTDDGLDDYLADEDDGLRSSRRGRRALILVAPVAVLALLLIVLLGSGDPSRDRRAQSHLIGRPAPPVAGATTDGRAFDSTTYDGRWLVVNFFATWCGPCIDEHPELVEFDRRHTEAGDADVVSVVFEDDEASVRRFFDRRGGDWPVVFAQNTVVADWGVVGVPETYIVAPDGTVAAKLIGGVTADGLDEALTQLGQGR